MIRVLNILGSLNFGGIETFLMNIYRIIDKNKIQFDFLICDTGENNYQDEAIKLGGKVYLLSSKKSDNIIKNLTGIYHVVKENKYQIVWRHTDNAFMTVDLMMAKMAGAGTTVIHAHSTQCTHERLGRAVWFFLNHFATERLACGETAGKWMFCGKPFMIIRNGIDIGRFSFREEIRKNYRKQFHIEDKFVLGHVGRFERAKNHMFILKVFEAFHRQNPESVLVLIGTGVLLEEVKAETRKLGLEKEVLFLGVRSDVAELMMMMDSFLFPSFYEGLPVTLVEAQATGLSCVVSDQVTNEIDITGKVAFLSLEDSAEQWARKLCEGTVWEREAMSEVIKNAGYDIQAIAEEVEKFIMDRI